MKKFLIALLAVPILIFGIGAVALKFWVNPNQFKPLIIEQAKAQAGLDLVIEGDLNWQFLPKLGISLGRTKILNPQGFDQENMLSIERAGLSLDILPLFSKQLKISNLALDDASIYWQVKADGHSNIDQALETLGLKQTSSDTRKITSANQASQNTAQSSADTLAQSDANAMPEDMKAWKVSLAGVNIQNASLTAIDEPMGLNLGFEGLNLTLANFAFNQWSTLNLSGKGYYNQEAFELNLTSDLNIDKASKNYSFKALSLNGNFSDKAQDLFVDALKLDLESLAIAHGQYSAQNAKLVTTLRSPQANLNEFALSFAKADLNSVTDLAVRDLRLTGQVNSPQGDLDLEEAKFNSLSWQSQDLAINEVKVSASGKTSDLSFPQLSLSLKDLSANTQKLLASSLSLQAQMQAADKPVSDLSLSLSELSSDYKSYTAQNIQGSTNFDAFGVKLDNATLATQKFVAFVNDMNHLTKIDLAKLSLNAKAAYQIPASDAQAVQTYNVQSLKVAIETLAAGLDLAKEKPLTSLMLRAADLDATGVESNQFSGDASLQLEKMLPNEEGQLKLVLKGKSAAKAHTQIDLTQTGVISVNENLNNIKLSKLALNATASGQSIPLSPLTLKAAGSLNYQIPKQQLNLQLNQLAANEYAFSGNIGVNTSKTIPAVSLNLTTARLNLDQLLSELTKKTAQFESPKQDFSRDASFNFVSSAYAANTPANQEPDLSALKTLDISGQLKAKQLTYQKVNFANLNTSFAVNRGVVNLNSFTAGVFNGSLSASGRLDARQSTPSYNIKADVKSIQIQPLLKTVADFNDLSGVGNLNLDAKGSSLIPARLKANLAGHTTFSLNNGVLHGVNIPYQIRKSYALLKGQTAPQEKNETKFDALKGRFDFKSGIATTQNLALTSDGLSAKAQGQANYAKESLDMNIQADLSKFKDLKGNTIKDLDGVAVPIRIHGPWKSPSYQLDLKGLLKTQAVKKVTDKAKSKIDKEIERFTGGDDDKSKQLKNAADSLLKGLFN